MPRSLKDISILRTLLEQYRERLTPRGQYLFWFVVVLAVLGLDTRRTQAYVLFSVSAGIFLAAALFAFLPPPKLRLDCQLPARLTALMPVMVRARMEGSKRGRRDLQFTLPRPRRWGSSVRVTPPADYFDIEPGGTSETQAELQISRRGRYAWQRTRMHCWEIVPCCGLWAITACMCSSGGPHVSRDAPAVSQ